MNAYLESADALSRHPEHVEALTRRVNAARKRVHSESLAPLKAEDLMWSYDVALLVGKHVDGVQRFGRDYFESKKELLSIHLSASDGRRQANELLDNKALLAGPDANLPWEVIGRPPQALPTSTPRVWLWQPSDPVAPGWAAYRVVSAQAAPVSTADAAFPQGMFLVLARQAGPHERQVDVWFDGQEQSYESSTAAFQTAVQQNPRTDDVNVAERYAALCNEAGYWESRVVQATMGEQVAALRGAGIVQVGVPHSAPAEPAPTAQSRRFDVHEALSATEQTRLQDLAPKHLAFGSAIDVLMSHAKGLKDELDPKDGVAWTVKGRWAVAGGAPVNETVADLERQRAEPRGPGSGHSWGRIRR